MMKNRSIKKEVVGTVVSDKMDKTVVVMVERFGETPSLSQVYS
jgi:ribosomal protein S17